METLASALLLLVTALTLLLVTSAQNLTVVKYEFTEEQPIGNYTRNLMRDTGLEFKIDPQFHSDVQFTFLQQSVQYKSLFEIEDGTGEFRTIGRLDREALCPFLLIDTCQLRLDISTRPIQDRIEIFQILIHILDINDNQPEFSMSVKQLPISELTEVGVSFALPAAIDTDSSKHNVQSYLLNADNSNHFQLQVGSSGGGLSDPRLVLKNRLDREQQDFYSLQLLAIDSGDISHTGTVTLQINVVDANDNPPTFHNHTYTITVDENIPIDTTVIIVNAEDADDGLNGQITYTLSQASQTQFGHLFSLHPSEGSITLVGLLDYDAPSSPSQYSLSIVATDNGDNQLSDYSTVVIYIRDVNDNEPRIVLNIDGTSPDNRTVIVSENAAVNSFVTHISVLDPDRGPSGEVLCVLDHAFFELVPLPFDKQYKLVTAATLDRETQQEFRVTITCQDKGDPPKLTTEEIKVEVKDENDHPPVFVAASYTASIRENNEISVQLTQVRATDDDVGENSRITFSVLPPHNEILDIDQSNGYVRAKFAFDYELSQHYDVIITASDHGDPPMSANVSLDLTVLDSNDEPPKFNHSHYTFGTLENQHPGTEVGVVEAVDIDSAPFNEIIYTIDTQSQDYSIFKIPDSKVGKITLRRVLDRELKDKYSIMILASNPGYTLHSIANVTIFVGDENDNAPQLIFPSVQNNTVQISSSAEKGQLVTKIKATDLDVGHNSYLDYSILAGNIHSVFTINPSTGEIFVNKSLENYEDRDIRMSVLVKDRGDQPLSVIGDLQVYINSSVVPAPYSASRATTNLQLIIILVLSVLAISLFLAVLIVLVTMRRKKKSKQNDNHRYKLDITFATPANGTVTSENNINEIISQEITVLDNSMDSQHKMDQAVDKTQYYNKNIKSTYVQQDPKTGNDSRKVHFAEADSAYDSLKKNENEAMSNPHQNQPFQQRTGSGIGNRPTYLEHQRHKLLYREPLVNGIHGKTPSHEFLPHNGNGGDLESDQGSSIDSGRGPSEDERMNTSISLLPNPHMKPSAFKQKPTFHQQKSYPDLVKCTCGASHSQAHSSKHLSSSTGGFSHKLHGKGCPQRLSPKEEYPNSNTDNKNDCQNLLGLPPKTYNKRKNKSLSSSGGHSDDSVSTHKDTSTKPRNKNSNMLLHPRDAKLNSSSSNSPRLPDYFDIFPQTQKPSHSPNDSNVNPQAIHYTQQCYNDIARQKKSKYNGSSKSSRHSSRLSHGDSDGESAGSGGSTTTSGSFTVGSVPENRPQVQQIHQVYV